MNINDRRTNRFGGVTQMKSVNEMDHFEKTMVIIDLIPNWNILGHGDNGDDIVLLIGGQWHICLQKPFYLYDQKWMWIAWRVLNWALEHLSAPSHFFQLREMVGAMDLFTLSPSDAQRAWLDKILTLAFEAGMVTE